MSSTYSTTDYLLDRANIHDTVTKLPWYYDTHSESGLLNEVFAPEIHIDYTRILGGQPSTVAATEWAPQVIRMCEHFDSSQHVYGGLIIELPQPNTTTRPDKAKVLSTQAGASMVRAAAEGGPLLQNGGRSVIEVTRLPHLDGNPWRISAMTVIPAWKSGNQGVMDGLQS